MKKVDKGGRPAVVFSDKQIKELQTLSAVLNKEQLADYFGVSHVTLKAIEKRQPEVSFAYKKGKAKAIAKIAGNLQKLTAATYQHKCFILKHRQVGRKQHV